MADELDKQEQLIDDAIDAQIIKKRSVQGIMALFSRTFILYGISILANILLSVLLSPAQYGIFFLVSAVINFLVYFSDIGLGAALIQKKDKLTDSDLSTTFVIQQILVLSLVVIALILSPRIATFYHLDRVSILLFYSLLSAFFMSSLKTIPSILLERELKFNKLIIPQLSEQLIYNFLAVFLAWRGFGVTSFTIAVFARGLVGLVLMYILKPWRPKLKFNIHIAKKLGTFGAPFQLNSLLGLVKDDLLFLFLGKTLSLESMGYIRWGQQWSAMPFRFFSDIILKVTFPAYSRLQGQTEELKKAIEKSIFVSSLTVFPAITGLITIAPFLVAQIPHYSKWQPALIALTLLGFNYYFSSISTILTNTLNALGKVKITLRMMFLWIVLTWVCTLIFIGKYGFNGYPLAVAVVSLSDLIVLYFVRQMVKIKVLPQILPSIIGSLIMFLFIKFAAPILIKSLPSVFLVIILAGLVYAVSIYLIAGSKVKGEIGKIYSLLKKT